MHALSPRESPVAHSAAQGLANKEIADELGVAPGTVAGHLSSALRSVALATGTRRSSHRAAA